MGVKTKRLYSRLNMVPFQQFFSSAPHENILHIFYPFGILAKHWCMRIK